MAQKISFEKSIDELEQIVKSLEAGEVSLDESLKLFERGIRLSAQCGKMLDEAEQKVSVLLQGADGDMAEKDFLPDEEA